MFNKLINSVKNAASSVYALWVLGVVSFLESALLPIPVDPVVLPIMFSNRKRLWQAALVASLTSVAGGCLGYYIGAALYDTLGQWVIETYGYQDKMDGFKASMQDSAPVVLFIAAVSPLPYKLVAIGSGIISVSFPLFFVVSAIGRSLRFFVMAGLIALFGKQITHFMERNAKLVTALIVIGTVLGFVAVYFI